MWAALNDGELVQRSEAVVLGAWVGQTEMVLAAGPGPLEIGVIAISEVLKGAPAQSVALVMMPGRDKPRSGDDIAYRVGDRGLWFLRARPGGDVGLYLADHPQRFVRATDSARIDLFRKLLARR